MARGRRWTDEENEIVARMYAEGASIEEIVGSLSPDRSSLSVKQQVTRLGLRRGIVATVKKSIVASIEGSEIMSREEALKALSAVAKRLMEGGEIDVVGLAHLRTINAVIRNYFAVFDSYEKYAELEARIMRLEELAKAAKTDTQGETR